MSDGRRGRLNEPLAIAAWTVILLIATFFVFVRLSAKFSDRYESFYPSLVEANKDGAITRGWIPDDVLPDSSRSIHEVHYLSPSREWCAFEFAPEDSGKLHKNLMRIDVLSPSVRIVRDPKVRWWPTTLKGNLNTQRIHGEGLDLYEIERPANAVMTDVLLFAIDWSNGRRFFYRTSESVN